MKWLFLLLLYFWVLLFENILGDKAIIFSVLNGLEIRVSLVFKFIFFFVNFFNFYKLSKNIYNFKFVLVFLFFLLFSSCYTLVVNASYFIGSLTQYVHIFLNFNIILFVFFNLKTVEQGFIFFKGIMYFAYFNAAAVIVSFFFPTFLSVFETGISETGVARSFGFMGDEVSMFLTFFVYKALQEGKKYEFLFFLTAILCTGSIGAFITTLFLFLYFFYVKSKRSKSFKVKFILSIFMFFFTLIIFNSQLSNFTVIKRINENFSGVGGTGELRTLSLSNGFEMFLQRPLLGVGYGAYSKSVMQNYQGVYDSLGNILSVSTANNILGSTYNPFLQIACESGIIGLFFFLYLLRNILRLTNVKLDSTLFIVQNFKKVSYGWLLIFFITCQSGNWFLPASFLMLLIMTLVGLNLKFNFLYKNK